MPVNIAPIVAGAVIGGAAIMRTAVNGAGREPSPSRAAMVYGTTPIDYDRPEIAGFSVDHTHHISRLEHVQKLII